MSLLFHREPSRTGFKPEVLVLQIADRVSPALAVARAQMLADREMVGVVTIVSDARDAPLVCDLGHDDLWTDDGLQRLLALIERLEGFAATRAP